MSYVDLIIKYLSGELSREDSRSFEKELESNAVLKSAFEEQSAAYNLIRSQLQKRDQEAFKAKLADAMSQDAKPLPSKKAGRRLWYLPPAIACFLALVLIIFISNPGTERVLARYHNPSNDPLILAYYQETRGKSEAGITQYHQGNYQQAMELLSQRLSQDKDNKLIRLFYLLSAMELDLEQEVLELMSPGPAPPEDLIDQSLCWYSSLALIKSERHQEALEKLQALTELDGAYQSDAIKLEKVLLK